MINKIVLLTDYKGFFGSKQKTKIYRGGMDLEKIIDLFSKNNYHSDVISFKDFDSSIVDRDNTLILYTSNEDIDNSYKSYIEDIVFHFERQGLFVLPSYNYLKAHNNKVAMELLRIRSDFAPIQTIESKVFGTIEELVNCAHSFNYPVVIKSASGAMSRGVRMAENPHELIRAGKVISKSYNFRHDIKELLRKLKYRENYIKESFFRKKFIVQNMIHGLTNDWKVLVYGIRCFALFRGVRKGDFRASGSGDFQFRKELPDGILDFAYSIKKFFKVANISLDIGFDGNKFHLLEFQFIHFGTTTLEKSSFYFEKIENEWILIEEKSDLENVYVESICDYLANNLYK